MQIPTSVGTGTSKQAAYAQICAQLQNLLSEETNLIANAANTAALLFHSLPDVNWVGFYFANGDEELIVGPFQGKPACVRIPFGKGVCGTAAATGESVIVPDVSDFPGHIACDPDSKSEIVVPLLNWGKVVGVLDLDSAIPNRFDEDDCEGLEAVAALFLSSQGETDIAVPDFEDEAAAQ